MFVALQKRRVEDDGASFTRALSSSASLSSLSSSSSDDSSSSLSSSISSSSASSLSHGARGHRMTNAQRAQPLLSASSRLSRFKHCTNRWHKDFNIESNACNLDYFVYIRSRDSTTPSIFNSSSCLPIVRNPSFLQWWISDSLLASRSLFSASAVLLSR